MTIKKALPPFFLGICLLGACSIPSVVAPQPTETPTATPSPTATPVPLAARVNGEGIPKEEFEHEVARFELAQNRLGNVPAESGDYRRTVLQSMIEERVAAQAARSMGRTILDEQIDAVVESCRQARGGDSGFRAWMTENFYSLEEFRQAIHRQLLIQAATDAVIEQVPTTAEQVHARHILVGNQELANALLVQITGGADFAELALKYSQDFSTNQSGGDLGWFPRGILSVAEVETAAFALQPGETSPVITSPLGHHIVETLERENARPVSLSALETLRRKAVEQWLAQQMQAAIVEIFI